MSPFATPNPDGLPFLAITPTVPSGFFAFTVNPALFSRLSFVITLSVTFAAVIVTVVGSGVSVISILAFVESTVKLSNVGAFVSPAFATTSTDEIGRASCRERVFGYV